LPFNNEICLVLKKRACYHSGITEQGGVIIINKNVNFILKITIIFIALLATTFLTVSCSNVNVRTTQIQTTGSYDISEHGTGQGEGSSWIDNIIPLLIAFFLGMIVFGLIFYFVIKKRFVVKRKSDYYDRRN
jgi:hypothetical protein